MGDYSYLVGWDPEQGTGVAPELEAKYYIPLFWMPMFEPGDLRSTVDNTFEKPPNATERFEDETYAYCEGNTALERLKSRITALGAATSPALAKKFLKFAQVYATRPVMLRISSLVDDAAQLGHVRAALAAVADPQSSAARFRAIANLSDGWEAQPFAENILVGWGTKLTAREREQAKQAAPSSKVNRAERGRVDAWRVSIDAVAPDLRKPYAASNSFAAGDVVEHVKFGPGLVVRLVEKTKLEVSFEHATVVLVHKP